MHSACRLLRSSKPSWLLDTTWSTSRAEVSYPITFTVVP